MGKRADNVFILGREPRVLAADCSHAEELHLVVTDPEVSNEWGFGTLLVGDKSLGASSGKIKPVLDASCIMDGKPKPFYKFVKSISPSPAKDFPFAEAYIVKLLTAE
eukprot:scaffold5808_cov14-Tisochrysis_lutea.AAC.1